MSRYFCKAVIEDEGGSGQVLDEHLFRSDDDIQPGATITNNDGHRWFVVRVEDAGFALWGEEDPASPADVHRRLVCRTVDE